MQQLMSVWSALDLRKRVIVVLATVAMFAAVYGLTRIATAPGMALLYSGLQSNAAGDVVKALDAQGVAYQVRGDAIWVDSTRRDALRMTLAAEGLPANGGAGYELLDQLSGFGTTAQMFDTAYWRATEGELARSIVTNPLIRAARVYISSGQSQPFRQQVKPTASIMVTTTGGTLPAAQAKALKFLVASAVSGLKPEDVAVIDSVGGLISGAGDQPSADSTALDRAEQLKRGAQALLDARVGPGRSVVAVTVEPVTDRETIVQKTFDPNGRVAISTDTTDNSASSTDKGAGAVTVASNLPDGDANANPQSSSQSQKSESRNRTNFEVSSTQREVLKAPGAIRKLSVAVLVDGIRGTGADGQPSWQPRSEEEIKALQDLVASAVGFDAKRGDVITIRSLAFEPVPEAGTVATKGMFPALNIDTMSLIQLVILAVVALILGLFVLRPILLSNRARPAAALALPGAEEGAQVLTGDIEEGDFLPGPMGQMNTLSFDDFDTDPGADADPVARLRRLLEERQDESMAILRSWVEQTEDRRT